MALLMSAFVVMLFAGKAPAAATTLGRGSTIDMAGELDARLKDWPTTNSSSAISSLVDNLLDLSSVAFPERVDRGVILSERGKSIRAAIGDFILATCVCETDSPFNGKTATEKIIGEDEIEKLATSILMAKDGDNWSPVEVPALTSLLKDAALNSQMFNLELLCSTIRPRDGDECDDAEEFESVNKRTVDKNLSATVGGVVPPTLSGSSVTEGDDLTAHGFDTTTDTGISSVATARARSVSVPPASHDGTGGWPMKCTSQEDCPEAAIESVGSNDDGWACPGDAEAEAALIEACPSIDVTVLTAVKAGEASAMKLLVASPEAIANTCAESCAAAVRISPCFISTTTDVAMLLCGCHAALDDTCQLPLRSAMHAALLGSSSITSGGTSPGKSSVSENNVLFCSFCGPSLMEIEECATLVPNARSISCTKSDTEVDSSLAGRAVGGGRPSVRRAALLEDNVKAVLDMILPSSVKVLTEAFIEIEEFNDLSFAQRVDILKEGSINGLVDAVKLPLREFCDLLMPNPSAALPSEVAELMPPSDVLTSACGYVEEECFQTTVDVCLGGSTEDLIEVLDLGLDRSSEIGWWWFPSDYWGEGLLPTAGKLLTDVIAGASEAVEYGYKEAEGLEGALNRVIGPMCTPSCISRIKSCGEVTSLARLFDIDDAIRAPLYSRGQLCNVVSAPPYSSGDKQRVVRMTATMMGLATVEDFTDALRFQFLQILMTAANVPMDQVRLNNVKAGSVVVTATVLFKANTDAAVQTYAADLSDSALSTRPSIFRSDYFGDVTVEVGVPEVVDPNDECPLCQSGSRVSVSAPVAAAALFVLAATLLMA